MFTIRLKHIFSLYELWKNRIRILFNKHFIVILPIYSLPLKDHLELLNNNWIFEEKINQYCLKIQLKEWEFKTLKTAFSLYNDITQG